MEKKDVVVKEEKKGCGCGGNHKHDETKKTTGCCQGKDDCACTGDKK